MSDTRVGNIFIDRTTLNALAQWEDMIQQETVWSGASTDTSGMAYTHPRTNNDKAFINILSFSEEISNPH